MFVGKQKEVVATRQPRHTLQVKPQHRICRIDVKDRGGRAEAGIMKLQSVEL